MCFLQTLASLICWVCCFSNVMEMNSEIGHGWIEERKVSEQNLKFLTKLNWCEKCCQGFHKAGLKKLFQLGGRQIQHLKRSWWDFPIFCDSGEQMTAFFQPPLLSKLMLQGTKGSGFVWWPFWPRILWCRQPQLPCTWKCCCTEVPEIWHFL